jgi:TPR repeat protein
MLILKKIIPAIIIATCITYLSACTQPNWFKAGKWNYTHQHYIQALPQLLWSAQMGDASAQYAVGYMYYNGLGTPQDDILAYHWLTKAAQAGNHNAATALQQIQGVHPKHSQPMPAKKEIQQRPPMIPTPRAFQKNTLQKQAATLPKPNQTNPQQTAALPAPGVTG